MTISANTVWEVRTTGSDTNGGGFVAGSGGTDYSQQAAAQVAVTDAVANGTTTITSSTANFASGHVGNLIYLAGGSGSLAATRRQVTAVNSATSITVDATVASGTGIALNLGGALASLAELASSSRGMVAKNKAFVKADGTYTTTANIAFAQNVATPSSSNPPSQLIGYTSSRTDGGQFTIQLNTTTSISVLTFSGNGWNIQGVSVNCNSLASSTGITLSASNIAITGCKVSNYGSFGINSSNAANAIFKNEVTAGTGSTAGIQSGGNNPVIGFNYVHDGAGSGISVSGTGGVVIGNVVASMSGASADGITLAAPCHVLNNTVYSSGRHGINQTTATSVPVVLLNNVLASNGGFGIKANSAAGMPAHVLYDGNAFYSNTSGTRSNMDDTSTNPVNGVAPYANANDAVLTAGPFVNAASGDFRLNQNPGGGAACRGAGIPRAWPGLSAGGFHDFGAIQHQDPSFAA